MRPPGIDNWKIARESRRVELRSNIRRVHAAPGEIHSDPRFSYESISSKIINKLFSCGACMTNGTIAAEVRRAPRLIRFRLSWM